MCVVLCACVCVLLLLCVCVCVYVCACARARFEHYNYVCGCMYAEEAGRAREGETVTEWDRGKDTQTCRYSVIIIGHLWGTYFTYLIY